MSDPNIDSFNSTTRFSDRVDDYLRYRPRYPAEIIPYLRDAIGLTPADRIADIGSGTGFLAEHFLRYGNRVFGVEPNKEMRDAGERFLANYPNFVSIDGTAERTTLAGGSVDIVAAAQAFHWFDPVRFRDECRRILTGKQITLLIWNMRDQVSTPFLRDYESLLQTYGTDYKNIRHHDLSDEEVAVFYGSAGCRIHTMPNNQLLDFTSLRGRLMSASYIPKEDDRRFSAMMDDLRAMFERHAEHGTVEVRYTTKMFFGTPAESEAAPS